MFLHKSASGCYYAGGNKWTADVLQAADLKEVAEALAVNARQALNATDLVVEYEDPPRVLRLGISELAPAAIEIPRFGASETPPISRQGR